MRHFLILSLALLPIVSLANGDDVKALVKKLASSSSAERQEATEALKSRPEAAPLLREALRSSDAEVAGRAKLLLDHFERRPLRELHAAVKEGDVEKAIKLAADWPEGKNEEEVFGALRQLARAFTDAALKKAEIKIDEPPWFNALNVPPVIRAARLTESTRAPQKREAYFLRAGEVDLDYGRLKDGARPGILLINLIVASGGVRMTGPPEGLNTIFAGGAIFYDGHAVNNVFLSCRNVTMRTELADSIVIARGDVDLQDRVAGSIVIAWGKVTCRYPVNASRIISGKSVHYNKKWVPDCKITENEANPMGYIRWRDPPKAGADAHKGKPAAK